MSEDTTTTWMIERNRAHELFGGTWPSGKDEDDIATAFAEHPTEIIAQIAKLADAYNAGKVHTPWRALHANLHRITRDNTPVDLSTDRRGHLAENWIRNAGVHCPTWAEVEHELFVASRPRAPGALLAGLEQQLAARMRALWETERPRGILADQQMLERAAKHRAMNQPTPAE